MERMPQVTLTELNELDRDGFTAALNSVFEYSTWIADRVAADRPLGGVRQLFDAMVSVVANMPDDQQRALIKVHPDLAFLPAVFGPTTLAASFDVADDRSGGVPLICLQPHRRAFQPARAC
jgi:2-oxo-4-hydroxy-4-carboxy--5-ureidoimidazoline (OHCU) decarboxylase